MPSSVNLEERLQRSGDLEACGGVAFRGELIEPQVATCGWGLGRCCALRRSSLVRGDDLGKRADPSRSSRPLWSPGR